MFGEAKLLICPNATINFLNTQCLPGVDSDRALLKWVLIWPELLCIIICCPFHWRILCYLAHSIILQALKVIFARNLEKGKTFDVTMSLCWVNITLNNSTHVNCRNQIKFNKLKYFLSYGNESNGHNYVTNK